MILKKKKPLELNADFPNALILRKSEVLRIIGEANSGDSASCKARHEVLIKTPSTTFVIKSQGFEDTKFITEGLWDALEEEGEFLALRYDRYGVIETR